MWSPLLLQYKCLRSLRFNFRCVFCSLKKILCSCSDFVISFARIKKKSPKRQLRALKKSYHRQPEAPPQHLFSNTSSGCLQDRRPTYFTFTSNSLWLVSLYFLSVSILLERTSLLQWSLPPGSQTKTAPRSPKTISADPQRQKDSPWSRKSPSTWLE